MADLVYVLGGGLVGSVLSVFLKKLDIQPVIYEKRPDIRKQKLQSGRSINLALSTRGWTALEKIGLKSEVEKIAIPMYGRMIHTHLGKTNFQPYSLHDDKKAIYSVSRAELNKLLLNEAEKIGVELHFDFKATKIDIENNYIGFRNAANEYIKLQPKQCFSADGAFSLVRSELIKNAGFDYEQKYLAHSYQEFHIPANKNGDYLLEKNALHIWPRASFMLIALPNLDGSFTCTLFLENKGEISFERIKNTADASDFFNTYFADALALMPDFETQLKQNPVSSLVTIKTFPWHKNNYCLLGDAAHAIVPFYGQGMNCGFEDCVILIDLIEKNKNNWQQICSDFETIRKPNTDAISRMALDNFLEMRDLVTDEHFLTLKKMEANIISKYPQKWQSQYEMVTFSNLPYSFALQKGIENNAKLSNWLAQYGSEYLPDL